jgi:EAL and modified HD-GYP domain-containing signal transduction protein
LWQWATVAALAALGEGQPEELVVTSLVRAMFLEQLAGAAGMGAHRLDLFLVGLLSALDALVGRPLEEVLAGLSLRPEVKATLTGQGSELDPPWLLAQTWERADFEKAYALAGDLGVPSSVIAEAYRTAVAKAEAVYRAS